MTHSAPGTGPLCSEGWIHVYDSAEVAELMDPIHGNFGETALLWAVEWSGRSLDDHGLKRGVQRCTTLEPVERSPLTTEDRVWVAILATGEVCTAAEWRRWATRWLADADRSAASAAAKASEAASWAASSASAASAAEAAAEASSAWASSASSAWASSSAAEASASAEAAAWAAAAVSVDLAELIGRARRREMPAWAVETA